MKPNYILIPLFTIAVALIGSIFTSQGLSGWYQTLTLPSWTPPGWVIGIVWNIIFILSTICALWVWNKAPHDGRFQLIFICFLLNGILNILWSYLFFSQHFLVLAIWEAGFLALSVVVLIVLIWPILPLAALLLVPYACWVTFATYLTFVISRLN